MAAANSHLSLLFFKPIFINVYILKPSEKAFPQKRFHENSFKVFLGHA